MVNITGFLALKKSILSCFCNQYSFFFWGSGRWDCIDGVSGGDLDSELICKVSFYLYIVMRRALIASVGMQSALIMPICHSKSQQSCWYHLIILHLSYSLLFSVTLMKLPNSSTLLSQDFGVFHIHNSAWGPLRPLVLHTAGRVSVANEIACDGVNSWCNQRSALVDIIVCSAVLFLLRWKVYFLSNKCVEIIEIVLQLLMVSIIVICKIKNRQVLLNALL